LSTEDTRKQTGAAGDMSCAELVEVITDYIEGTLPADDRRRFEAHLEICPYCVSYLEQMQETISTLGELKTESLSSERQDELLEAFRGWRGSTP
jgi:anti-sigma factor RsiW